MKYLKVSLNFLLILFIFLSCRPDTVLQKSVEKCIINFECTKYCFPDGYCTDFFCLVSGNPDCVEKPETKKSKKIQHIKRLNLSEAKNTEVIEQFLLALHLYEDFEDSKNKKDRLHVSNWDNYFSGTSSSNVYKALSNKYPNSEFIIKNLGSLPSFDIKNKVEVKKREDPKGFWIYVKNTNFSCRLDSSFYYDHASIFN